MEKRFNSQRLQISREMQRLSSEISRGFRHEEKKKRKAHDEVRARYVVMAADVTPKDMSALIAMASPADIESPCVCVYVCVYVYIYVYICECIYIYIYIYFLSYVFLYMYVDRYMYICIYVFIYKYV